MRGAVPMPVDEALGRLLDLAQGSPADIEELELALADGRVLARNLFARTDSPPWANSAMDGYAFRLADLDGRALRISQTIFAGQAPVPLEPGTCARIYTGAPLPAVADGLLEVPAGRTFAAGDWLDFLPFDGLWGAANGTR